MNREKSLKTRYHYIEKSLKHHQRIMNINNKHEQSSTSNQNQTIPLNLTENQSIFHEEIDNNQHEECSTLNRDQIAPLSPILLIKNENRIFNIIIEGNIGSGKTTLLQYFNQFKEAKILTFREPLEEWSNFNGSNLLDLMYKDRANWTFPFQTYALLTMLKIHQIQTNQKIKIMERSFHSSRIFLEANKIFNTMNPIQYQILDDWHKFIEREFPIHVDLIIYLRTTPDILMDRIKRRNRFEEQNMDLKYLEIIHQLHDDWLLHELKPSPAPIFIIDGNQSPNEIIEKLKLLNIDNLV